MKKNNKGSAFVMVLVILAIVGILAAVALWVSLVNYQMKLTDIKVKDNFYSAESVLDQISVGLQKDVSDSYQKAYQKVVVNYASMSDAQRQSVFEAQFKRELKDLLKGSVDKTYKLSHLTDYVYADWLTDTTYPYARIQAIQTDGTVSDTTGSMVTYDNHILLKGIDVTYTDADGFTSKIQTDISLKVPELKFTSIDTMPDTFGYSIVGDSGVMVVGNPTITGSVYAGLGEGTPPADGVSLAINGNVTFNNLQYLVSEGTAKLGATNNVLTVSEGSQFWAENIVVEGASTANLEGETYVADDLTLKGNNPRVKLGKAIAGSDISGRYVGFGTSKEDPAKSSSIILNGKESSLDMSNLRELLLGGYSYIRTSALDSMDPAKVNKNITMGESIAIKGGQLAYLVPAECIAIDNSTKESMYHSNPITYEEYAKMFDATDGKPLADYTEIDEEYVVASIGKSLKDYMEPGETIEKIVSRVFVPSGSNSGLVYYYINLKPEKAALYYSDYNAHADLNKLKMYTDFYTDKIQVKETSAAIYTAGNYTLFDGTQMKLNQSMSASIGDTLIEYSDNFEALVRTLAPNPGNLTTETKTKKAFSNLINMTKFQEVVPASGTPLKVSITDPVVGEMQAVLVDGNYNYNSTEDSGGKVALIIATGNVSIDQNYTGTIIAKGKIQVNGWNVNSKDGELMKKVLAATIPGHADVSIYNIFNEGSGYIAGTGVGGAADTIGVESIPYADIITYQNWRKK